MFTILPRTQNQIMINSFFRDNFFNNDLKNNFLNRSAFSATNECHINRINTLFCFSDLHESSSVSASHLARRPRPNISGFNSERFKHERRRLHLAHAPLGAGRHATGTRMGKTGKSLTLFSSGASFSFYLSLVRSVSVIV